MIITCPKCETTYEVEETKLRPSGRSVRCAQCRELWVVTPPPAPPALPAASVPAVAEPMQPARAEPSAESFSWDALPADPDDADREFDVFADDRPPAARALDPPAPTTALAPSRLIEAGADGLWRDTPGADRGPEVDGSGRSGSAGPRPGRPRHHLGLVLTGCILFLVAALAVLAAARTAVVRVAPQTARVYAALGLPVNLRGLVFEGVKLGYEVAEGVSVMVIEGTIANKTKRETEVPRLRFAVRNADRLETYAWTALPAARVLAAGESLPFRTRLASPPADARDVLVRFHNRRDLAGGG